MPSGKTHDAITVVLALPIFTAAWYASGSVIFGAVIAVASLFGGLVFSPDLDTHSKQYTRWGPMRFVWLPYRLFFKHRSRFTHGIVFGTILRTIYLFGVLTLAAFLVIWACAFYMHGSVPDLISLTQEWRRLGELISQHLGVHFAWFVFLGLWLGAISHSLTDIAGTYVKTGKVKGML